MYAQAIRKSVKLFYVLFRVFFFFQAEDGIRDPLVTGVQTCALPISWVNTSVGGPPTLVFTQASPITVTCAEDDTTIPKLKLVNDSVQIAAVFNDTMQEIGRASCRERV